MLYLVNTIILIDKKKYPLIDLLTFSITHLLTYLLNIMLIYTLTHIVTIFSLISSVSLFLYRIKAYNLLALPLHLLSKVGTKLPLTYSGFADF